jgi:hypothetical protein
VSGRAAATPARTAARWRSRFTAAGVGVVLTLAAGLPYLASFASVAVCETVVRLAGNALLVRRT